MYKKLTYSLLAVVLLLIAQPLLAQSSKISIPNTTQKQQQKKSKFSRSSFNKVSEADLKLNEAEKIFDTEPEKALDLVHDALLIAIKDDYDQTEAKAYQILGRFNFDLNEYNLSYRNYKKAIAIYDKMKLVSNLNYFATNQLYKIYYNTGKSAELIGNIESAIKYYNTNLKETIKRKDVNATVKTHIALGDCYLKLEPKELKGAQVNYNKALTIEKNRTNKKGIVLVNQKLGQLENEKNNTEKAIEYFRSSQSTAIQINDDEGVNNAFNDISEIHQTQNNIDDGIEINQEALEYNNKRDNKTESANNNFNLANLYLQQNKDDQAIEQLQNSIQIADETGDLYNLSRATQVLSEAYDKTGLSEEAMKKYKEYLVFEDSLYQLKNNQLLVQNKKGEMLENAQNKLSLLEKDKQLSEKTIELLRQEKIINQEAITNQKIITYSLILGIIILLITSYLVYRSNKAKNKANQLLVLKSLRAQMNPHFIFNALNSVNSFISKNDERAANRYLADFSQLMRDVMENSQEEFISLTKEIDILAMYIKLENHRFKDKFDYSFNVEESINTEDFLIPPMLIQPYIENAVWHGLRYKKEKGFLKVNIKKEEKSIIVSIEDDGIGRKKSQELKTENQKIMKSTGIKNIDSRLKIIADIYKTKLNVAIEDADLANQSGTIVTVKIHQENFSKTEL